MDPCCRRAASRDLEDLVTLLKHLFSIEQDFSFDAESHRRGLRMLLDDRGDRSVLIVAEQAGRVVGMVSVQLVVSTAMGGLSGWLEDLVVLPDYQGAGIGKALLREAIQWCAGKGCKRVQLLADKDNPKALEFYDSRRWRRTSMIPLRIHL